MVGNRGLRFGQQGLDRRIKQFGVRLGIQQRPQAVAAPPPPPVPHRLNFNTGRNRIRVFQHPQGFVDRLRTPADCCWQAWPHQRGILLVAKIPQNLVSLIRMLSSGSLSMPEFVEGYHWPLRTFAMAS